MLCRRESLRLYPYPLLYTCFPKEKYERIHFGSSSVRTRRGGGFYVRCSSTIVPSPVSLLAVLLMQALSREIFLNVAPFLLAHPSGWHPVTHYGACEQSCGCCRAHSAKVARGEDACRACPTGWALSCVGRVVRAWLRAFSPTKSVWVRPIPDAELVILQAPRTPLDWDRKDFEAEAQFQARYTLRRRLEKAAEAAEVLGSAALSFTAREVEAEAVSGSATPLFCFAAAGPGCMSDADARRRCAHWVEAVGPRLCPSDEQLLRRSLPSLSTESFDKVVAVSLSELIAYRERRRESCREEQGRLCEGPEPLSTMAMRGILGATFAQLAFKHGDIQEVFRHWKATVLAP